MSPDSSREGESAEILSEEYQRIDAFLSSNIATCEAKGFKKLKIEVSPHSWKSLAQWLATDLYRTTLSNDERAKILDKYRTVLEERGDIPPMVEAVIASQAIEHAQDEPLPSGLYSKEAGRTYEQADAAQRAAGDYDARR